MTFPSTYTGTDVANHIKRTFGDESGVQVTDSDILRWINAALIEIVDTNKILKGVATTPSVADQDTYTLAPTIPIMNINSIHYDSRKLVYKSFIDAESYITNEDPDKIVRGTPEFWYEWAGEIMLYPIPDTSALDIKVYYYATPTLLSALSENITIPDNYYNRVIEFVLSAAYEMDENLQAYQTKITQFNDNILNMSLNENIPQMDTYETITVLPEDR